jgi:hypothetical protein
MKNVLLDIINNDTSYNKSATRYLYKTHSDLWKQILDNTQFLPDAAKPKQRIWHIVNEIWEIPKCPITGIDVKWWENRYLETANRSAKGKMQKNRGDFKNLWSPEVNAKRKDSNLAAVKIGRNYRDKSTYTEEQKQKTKQTMLVRYGVENASFSPIIRKKISDKSIERGAVPKHMRGAQRRYYDAVQYYTRINYRRYKNKINPFNFPRKLFHLDHSFSVMAGFWNGVPPEIIGHWTNLQMLYSSDNLSKGQNCFKTIEELFETYYLESWKDDIVLPYSAKMILTL